MNQPIKAENKLFTIEERQGDVVLSFKKTEPFKVVRLKYEEVEDFLVLFSAFCDKALTATRSSPAFVHMKNNGQKEGGNESRVTEV